MTQYGFGQFYFIATMLLAIGIVISLIAGLALWQFWRFRKLEHVERMKALELGLDWAGPESWWIPGRVCVAIGLVVPVGVFLIAAVGAMTLSHPADGLWGAAGAIGVTGLICGTVLATQLPAARQRSGAAVPTFAKPEATPEAFDFAGRRD